MFKLVIPGRFPSLNEYINAERSNRYSAAKMKKQFSDLVFYYIKSQLPNEQLKNKAQLAFKWYEPNQKRDLDNIAFAKKFILDGLVKAGTLIDDSQKYVIGFSDEFFVDKLNPRVEIFIDC